MQVVSPSLWYVVLLGQLYLAFPLLLGALRRVGPWWFLTAAAATTWIARVAAFRHALVPGFDAVQTVICFIPFRLLAPAAGMVAARWADSLARPPRRALLWLLSPVAASSLLAAVWVSRDLNTRAPGWACSAAPCRSLSRCRPCGCSRAWLSVPAGSAAS